MSSIICLGNHGSGDNNQIQVSELMKFLISKHDCKLVLGLGNNILPNGVKSPYDDQFDENFHRYQEYEQNGYSMQDAQAIYDSFFGRGNDPFETFSGFGRNDGGSNKRRVIVQTTTTTVEHESDSFFNLGNGPSFQMLGNNDDGYM